MNMSKRTLVIITICVSVFAQIIMHIPVTFAQNSSEQTQSTDPIKIFPSDSKLSGNSSNYLNFESPTHGVSMSYPSNWTLSTSGLPEYTQIVAFYSPLNNISDTIPARLSISVFSYENNISLIDFTNMTLSSLNGSQQFGIISSEPITVDSKPGYQVILSTLPSMQNPIPFGLMNTWTVLGNHLYLLSYSTDSSEFSRYLPLVEKMLSSFKIHENS